MKSILKINSLILCLFFVAGSTLNAKIPCSWTTNLIEDIQASSFAVTINEYPGSDFYLDPCTNHCFVVNIDPGLDNYPNKFRIICEETGYDNLATLHADGIYRGTICIGLDAGNPISLPTKHPITFKVENAAGTAPATGNPTMLGGASVISMITNMLSSLKAKFFEDTAICTVMIGG